MFKFRGLLCAVLVVVGLIAPACGGSDPASSASPEDSSRPPATDEGEDPGPSPGPETARVRLLLPAATFSSLPHLVALGAGLFEEEGLEIEQMPYLPNTAQSALTTVTGDSDIAVTDANGLFAAVVAGRPVVGVSSSTQRSTLVITVGKAAADELASEGVTPDSPLADRVQALSELTIVTTAAGGTAEQQARRAMLDFGVEPRDSQFIAVSDTAAAAAAVREGTADAMVSGVPASLVPTADGRAVVWINGAVDEVPAWGVSYGNLTVTSQSFADENPETVRAFNRALARASELIADDPAAAKEAAATFFPEMDPALLDQSFSVVAPAFFDGLSLRAEGFDSTVELFNRTADTPLDDSVTFADVFRDDLLG